MSSESRCFCPKRTVRQDGKSGDTGCLLPTARCLLCPLTSAHYLVLSALVDSQDSLRGRHALNAGGQLACMSHCSGPTLKNGLDNMVAVVTIVHIYVHGHATV